MAANENGLDENNANENRISDISWCLCSNCILMTTVTECLCCKEIANVSPLLVEEKITCITKHSAFALVCLNRHVLKTALIARNDLRPNTLVESISNE